MPKFIATAATLILLALAAVAAEKPQTHFDKAVVLYTKGPSQAEEILRLIELELKERPENSGAYVLKALTLMGTKRCPQALKVVDELEHVPALKGKVYPLALEVRAKCLCAAGKYAEARAALAPYREHFQQKEEWRQHYEMMMAAIDEVLRNGAPK